MNSTIYENDITRFIYGETSAKENRLIVEALRNNPALAAHYEMMIETIAALDKIEYEPNPTSIEIIMEQAASHLGSLEHQ